MKGFVRESRLFSRRLKKSVAPDIIQGLRSEESQPRRQFASSRWACSWTMARSSAAPLSYAVRLYLPSARHNQRHRPMLLLARHTLNPIPPRYNASY
jgi:hypothetical protein